MKKIIFLLLSIIILSSCDKINDLTKPLVEIEEDCVNEVRNRLGDTVIVKVNRKTHPPIHGTIDPSCTFDFINSNISFTKYSLCNSFPGMEEGENINYMYGYLKITGIHESNRVIDEEGIIKGKNYFKFSIKFSNIEQYYPDNVTHLDHQFDEFIFPVQNVSFSRCTKLNNTEFV